MSNVKSPVVLQNMIVVNINKFKTFINNLAYSVEQQQIISYFKQICAHIIELFTSIEAYFKGAPAEKTIRVSVLLYLSQIYAALSFLKDIFIKEIELLFLLPLAQNCATNQLLSCLDGLYEIFVEGKTVDDPSGNFLNWMDNALQKLSEIDVLEGSDKVNDKFESTRVIIEEVLCHGMSIAQVAHDEDCKIIKGSSKAVLDALESLKSEISSSCPNMAMCNLFVDICSEKLCSLERKVNTAVLRLCLKVFASLTKPLENIEAHCIDKTNADTETLDSLIIEYDLHVDRLMQIGIFAVACSTDLNKILKIRSRLASLEALEGDVVPAFTSVDMKSTQQNLNYAYLLRDNWINHVRSLKHLIYFIIEPTAFCQVVSSEIHEMIEELSDNIKNRKTISKSMIAPILNNTSVLLELFKVYLDDPENIDIKFKDNVKQQRLNVKNVLSEVKAAVDQLITNNSTDISHQKILKRCRILHTMIKRLGLSLNNDLKMCEKEETTSNKVLSDVTNNFNNDIEQNPLIKHIMDRGKQLVKDRSILYRSPAKKQTLQVFEFSKSLSESASKENKSALQFNRSYFGKSHNKKNLMGQQYEFDTLLADLTSNLLSICQSCDE